MAEDTGCSKDEGMSEEFVVLDTETTGVDLEDRPVEIALVRVASGERFSSLINPQRSIPPTASAIHGLIDEDVEDAPTLAMIEPEIVDFIGAACLVAHNAAFDRSMLPYLAGHRWLCSLRLARHLWPEAPAYGNQVLRYWMRLRVDTAGLAPHRALADALVTAAVFAAERAAYRERFGSDDAVRLIAFAESPIYTDVLHFGKAHYGKRFEEVPLDYFRWMLREVEDLDRDLRASIEKHLKAA